MNMAEKEMLKAECGHKTKLSGIAKAFGAEKQYNLKVEDGKIRICLQCLGDAAIRCTWCGKTIFPGDPVTLYTPTEKGFIKTQFAKPAYAVAHDGEGEGDASARFVGCITCAIKPQDRKGFWLHPGRVLLIQKS